MPHLSEREPQKPDWQVLLDRYAHAWERYSQQPTLHNQRVLTAGEQLLIRELGKPGKFPMGQIVATPAAMTAMEDAGHIPPEFLIRHKYGDWGELDPEDRQENELSLINGWRLLSAYSTRLSERLWVITEADRSVTTLLLPEDY